MNADSVYFLVRRDPACLTCYARGIPVLTVFDLYRFRIVRMYPDEADLTPRLVAFQRKWRRRRDFRRMHSNPRRLFYREQTGRFPSLG
jgi:hypothetical protein